MRIVDRTVRTSGRWAWWRVAIYVWRKEGFVNGDAWMYRGLVRRNARSFGPVHVALLRLVGDGTEPYGGEPPGTVSTTE